MGLCIGARTPGQRVVIEPKISKHLGGQDMVGQQAQSITGWSNSGRKEIFIEIFIEGRQGPKELSVHNIEECKAE